MYIQFEHRDNNIEVWNEYATNLFYLFHKYRFEAREEAPLLPNQFSFYAHPRKLIFFPFSLIEGIQKDTTKMTLHFLYSTTYSNFLFTLFKISLKETKSTFPDQHVVNPPHCQAPFIFHHELGIILLHKTPQERKNH